MSPKECTEMVTMEKESTSDILENNRACNSPEYPTGLKLATLLLSIYLSIFLVALDRTIIATAIPQITDHFQSFDDIGWVLLFCVL
jgi:hypothetical protein